MELKTFETIWQYGKNGVCMARASMSHETLFDALTCAYEMASSKMEEIIRPNSVAVVFSDTSTDAIDRWHEDRLWREMMAEQNQRAREWSSGLS